MTPLTRHCGYCGKPMRDCGNCAEREAVMRAVCPSTGSGQHDAFALINVPPPIVPPATAPHAYAWRYGVKFCTTCGLAAVYCKADAHAAPEVAANDGAHSDLNRRIADCKGR
jgi:hypothetical protein